MEKGNKVMENFSNKAPYKSESGTYRVYGPGVDYFAGLGDGIQAKENNV